MSRPLVSVTMLTYNHAPYVARAIESVVSQEADFDFELIVGEDCSTDGTAEIVREYSEKHPETVRMVTSDSNVGSKKNFERILAACRGKYLAICEGDDHWHDVNKLQKQVEYLESHPECGLVYSDSDWNYVSSGRTVHNFLRTNGQILDHEPTIVDIVNRDADIRSCTVMARLELVKKIREEDWQLHGSPRFIMGDTQTWAELSMISDVHYMDESMSTYQILDESFTQSKDLRKGLRFRISDAEMYLYLCTKYDLPDWLQAKHRAAWRRESLRLSFFDHRPELADDVRAQAGLSSFPDLIWYLASKYSLVRAPFSLFLRIRGRQ